MVSLRSIAALALAALAPPALGGTCEVAGFALELADPEAPGAPPRTIGCASWTRREDGLGLQLEWSVRFFAGEGEPERRVFHVERLTREGARLVWREQGDGAGRCLVAEWTDDGGGLRTIDWSGRELRRDVLDAGAGAVMPLYLIELAREGRAGTGTHLRFEPLARAVEPVSLATAFEPEIGEDVAHAARTVELVRADGTLAGRWRFRGTRLEAFAWQEQGIAGRRVEGAELEALFGGPLAEAP